MADTFTAADIARRLNTPESTVRYHARRFAAYVPTVGAGRSRRYRAEALDALRFIGEQLQAGAGAAEVEAALAGRFALTVEPQQQPVATQQPDRNNLADAFTTLLSDVAELRSESAELLRIVAERFAAQEAVIAALRSVVDELRQAAVAPALPPPAPDDWLPLAPRAAVPVVVVSGPRRPWWRALLRLPA